MRCALCRRFAGVVCRGGLVGVFIYLFAAACPALSQELSGSVLIKLRSAQELQGYQTKGATAPQSSSSSTVRSSALTIAEEYGLGAPEHFLYPTNATLRSASLGVKGNEKKDRYVRLTPPSAANLDDVVASLSRDPRVAYAEKETILRATAFPNDPLINEQYAHAITQAHLAWDVHTGGTTTTIAIVDTGVQPDHPDLRDSLVPGESFVGPSTTDEQGHGTHCAGIAAASGNNGQGIAGVSWAARIMPVQVLDASGSGTTGAVAAGIRYAAEQGASVISLSLGGSAYSQTLQDAVTFARGKDAVVIAAAGNDGTSDLHYPAGCQGVVAVGATDSLDQRTPWSNYGDWVTLFAPGRSILSTYLKSSYRKLNGTSMATPYVAGAAALLRSYSPGLNEQEVRSALQQATDDIAEQNPGQVSRVLQGRLNMARLLGLLPRATARFSVVGLAEVVGNQDGQLTAGEEVAIRIAVRNLAPTATTFRIAAGSESPDLEILQSEQSIGSVAGGSVSYPGVGSSIIVRIRNNARVVGDVAEVSLRLLTDQGEAQRISTTLPLGYPQISGFPLVVPQARSAGSVIVNDLDGDGDQEVVFPLSGTVTNYLWVVDSQGRAVPSWPKPLSATTNQGPIGHHVAIGNIVGDSRKEIAVGVRGQYSFLSSAPVYVFSSNGDVLPGFPRKLGAPGFSPSKNESVSHGATIPTLADIDGNGLLDLVLGEGVLTDATDVVGPSRIFAIAGDGSDLPGFPLEVPERISPGSPLVVDDLDGNGSPEFATITGFSAVQAWNQQGTSLLRHLVRQGGKLFQPPLGLASVQPYGNERSLSSFGPLGVSLVSTGGIISPGFPSVAGLPRAPDTWASEGEAQTPFWRDFDGDGIFEGLSVTSATVYYENMTLINAIDSLGNVKAGFPIQLRGLPSTKITGQVLVEDLDGDRSPELIIPLAHGIEIRSPFGKKSFSASIPYPSKCYLTGSLTPTIGDINSNGVPEVIFPCQPESFTLKIHAFELSGAQLTGERYWPMYQQDGTRSGRFQGVGTTPPTPTPSPTPTATATRTPTSTPTSTPTFTVTPTPTVTVTPPPTMTATPTATLTPTLTPSRTPTASPMMTKTATPSTIPTGTPSLSPSPTSSSTPSATSTPNVAGEPSPVPTVAPTPPGPLLTPLGMPPTPITRPSDGADRVMLELVQVRSIKNGRTRLRVRATGRGTQASETPLSSRLWVSIQCARDKRRVRHSIGVRYPGAAQTWMKNLSPRMTCQAKSEYLGRTLTSRVSRLR